MKWDVVLAKMNAVAVADSILAGIYKGAVRLAGTGDHRVPLLELQLIADGEAELWVPHTIQWDQFTKTSAELVRSERQLRRLFHRDGGPADFDGVKMWAQYVDGAVLAVPSRDKYYGRAIRFRMTPLRELYEPATL